MEHELTRPALRVLVVDDDQLVRAAMRRSLAHLEGARVDDFTRPNDALAACGSAPFDVGVFDLEMPEMNGVDLAQRVRALFPSIRVLFVSSDLTSPLAVRARAMGPLLPKPWPEAELLRLVRG